MRQERRVRIFGWAGAVCAAGALSALVSCGPAEWEPMPVTGNQEQKNPDGSLFTPNTQSFLRGHHWLDTVTQARVEVGGDLSAVIRLDGGLAQGQGQAETFAVHNLNLEMMVPRLHYPAPASPDAFDAFNLMLAEFSRNGVSVPVGAPGDTNAHFETTLSQDHPWKLGGAYTFIPEPLLRPMRFTVVNNCLMGGLWELEAVDRAGEIYHGWMTVPAARYSALLAEVNGLAEDFAAKAVSWSTEPAKVDLSRLRTVRQELGEAPLALAPDEGIGFSSQTSRRKIGKSYVLMGEDNPGTAPISVATGGVTGGATGGVTGGVIPTKRYKPKMRSELAQGPIHLVDFQPPGRYSATERRTFDVGFLGKPERAEVRLVAPLTGYRAPFTAAAQPEEDRRYVEILLHLGDRSLVIGNLPLDLLVPQEEFVLHGFGVGILNQDEPAERRALLLDQGPRPSFAYLMDADGREALNNHESGLEQIFIRARLDREIPVWEVTITSFERIVDLAKYEVEIPAALREEVRRNASRYTTPIYLTYRDDNLL